jgi:hypothetical protein
MGRLACAHDPERGGYQFGGWQLETRRSADQLAATDFSFDMLKTPGCSSEQIGVVRPALLRSADIEHLCDLTTILVCSTVIQI